MRNRWFRSGRGGLKEVAAVLLSGLMMYGIYFSTLSGLQDIKRTIPLSQLDPAIPLGVVLAALFLMIYLSAAVTALGSLFMSRDLDLVLATPVTPHQFLTGKALDVGISVSWMVCIFGFPSLMAFGEFYGGDALFMVAAPFICLTFFSLAIVAGILTALLFAAVLPSERSKQLLLVLFLASLALFVTIINGASSHSVSGLNKEAVTATVRSVTTVASNPWLPSTHCANAIAGLLHGNRTTPLLYTLEFAGTFAILWGFITRAFTRLFDRGMSRTRQSHGFVKIHSRLAQRASRIILPFFSSPTRAIMTKEYKVFSRDITHTVQLALLLGITFIYLYNYQILQGPDRESFEVMAAWNIFLLLSNIALGALVITSICSRFVFPSVSLEGSAFWLLQSAPVSLRDVLRAKSKSWIIPISLIGGVICISGAMALNAEVPLVVASGVAGLILCHGLVGLGVGLGALFSQFEWEHPTQLSTSLGSFLFMFISMIFLAVNMIPLGLMFGTYLLFPEHTDSSRFCASVLGSGLALTYIMNKGASWWALTAGARALRPR
jgi:ABC-2 type transport system permease protein